MKMREQRCAANLPYAEIIFRWRRQFNASMAGRRVVALISPYRTDFMLAFFTWDDELGTKYNLFMIPDGIRWYRWGPGSQEELCFTPEDLAAAASETPRMLVDACDAIKTGEVWQWIKEDIVLCAGVVSTQRFV